MIRTTINKIFKRKPPGPVTGWVKYRDHMVPAPVAAERDYILSLYKKTGGGTTALYILNGYMFTDIDAAQAEADFNALIEGLVTP